jgi:hypothetical protein
MYIIYRDRICRRLHHAGRDDCSVDASALARQPRGMPVDCACTQDDVGLRASACGNTLSCHRSAACRGRRCFTAAVHVLYRNFGRVSDKTQIEPTRPSRRGRRRTTADALRPLHYFTFALPSLHHRYSRAACPCLRRVMPPPLVATAHAGASRVVMDFPCNLVQPDGAVVAHQHRVVCEARGRARAHTNACLHTTGARAYVPRERLVEHCAQAGAFRALRGVCPCTPAV